MRFLHDNGTKKDLSEFGALDQFFAKRVLKEAYTDARAHFLKRLMQASRLGHLCLVENAPPDLPNEIVQNASSDAPIVQDGNRFYLQKNWVYETEVITHVKRLIEINPSKICDKTQFEQELNQTNLEPKQRDAALTLLNQSMTILCGGPGTGKTYTVAAFVRSLIKAKKKNSKFISQLRPEKLPLI